MEVCCGSLNRLGPTCSTQQKISNARWRSNSFQIILVILLLQLRKMEIIFDGKMEVVSFLLTYLRFFSLNWAPDILFMFPGHPNTASLWCPQEGFAFDGLAGKDRLHSWPANCCILYSSACGLSTWDQRPCSTGLRLFWKFPAVV